MNPMIEKLNGLTPEIAMLIGAIACLFSGLMNSSAWRKYVTPLLALITLLMASIFGWQDVTSGVTSQMAGFAKTSVPLMGILLLMLLYQTPLSIKSTKLAEANHFNPDHGRNLRGEFFAFFLLSLTGVMLCADANDLVWMFLALELTSLPTYIMVAVMRDKIPAQEAGVKYFFLGAMAAAVFLYGFTLMYGGTGTTTLISHDGSPSIFGAVNEWFYNGEELSPLLIAGTALAIIGISFKIAAVPMHFYTADVYQGAAMPVTAFLAFVPKAAGFFCLITLIKAVSGSSGTMPDLIGNLIALLAVTTMTLGNVMALIQRRLKRVMAYSSIAHSGYMLVGLLAAPVVSHNLLDRGDTAILFYLITYGLSNVAVFGVLSLLRSHDGYSEDAETFEDLKGLREKNPLLCFILLVGALSLIGLPPLVGFLGKIQLFSGAMKQGYGSLVTIAVINSAISAAYYLRIPANAFFSAPVKHAKDSKMIFERYIAAFSGAILCIYLGFAGNKLINMTNPEVKKPAQNVEADVQDQEALSLNK